MGLSSVFLLCVKLSVALVLVFLAAVVLFPYPTGQIMDELLNTLSGGPEYNKHVSARHGVLEPVTTEIQDPIPLKLLQGAIPEEMNGAYLRIGPNELSGRHHGRMTYHLFDGHGFVHVVALNGKDQSASYSRAWLKTPRFLVESLKGRDVFMRIGTMFLPYLPFRLLTDAMKQRAFNVPLLERGTANTNIKLMEGGRLFALNEGSLPFEFALRPQGSGYAIESIGYETYEGRLDEPMTAHPRQDPKTGSTVFASYNPRTNKFPVGEIDANNNLVSLQNIHGRHEGAIGWAHDAALTEHYVVIPDGGSVFDVRNFQRGVFVDLTSTLGFTIVPRNNDKTTPHFAVASDLPASIVHIATAWETADAIVVAAPTSTDLLGLPVNQDTLKYIQFNFTKLTLPKQQGGAESIKIETIDAPQCSPEFPRVHPMLDGGYKVRYAFASCIAEPGDKREGSVNFSGWAKFDLDDMKVAAYVPIPKDWMIGEMAPVAKHKETEGNHGSDAVWLVGVMIHVDTLESRIVIYDGEHPSEEPVAVLQSPERIPAGFHSQFYSESMLKDHFARATKQEQKDEKQTSDEL